MLRPATRTRLGARGPGVGAISCRQRSLQARRVGSRRGRRSRGSRTRGGPPSSPRDQDAPRALPSSLLTGPSSTLPPQAALRRLLVGYEGVAYGRASLRVVTLASSTRNRAHDRRSPRLKSWRVRRGSSPHAAESPCSRTRADDEPRAVRGGGAGTPARRASSQLASATGAAPEKPARVAGASAGPFPHTLAGFRDRRPLPAL